MPINVVGDANSGISPSLGNFIEQGTGFNQRPSLDDEYTFNETHAQLILSPISLEISFDPGTYTYVNNAEFRIVQGWVRRGLTDLLLVRNNSTFYTEFSYSDFRILKDFVISRRLLGSGLPTTVCSVHKNINLKFNWTPNKNLHFSETESQYNGWYHLSKSYRNTTMKSA